MATTIDIESSQINQSETTFAVADNNQGESKA